MKGTLLFRYFFIFFVLFLLNISRNVTASFDTINLLDEEWIEVINNNNVQYVCLDEKISNIAEVVLELSKLDKDINSQLSSLCDHIKKGFIVARKDEVLDSLKGIQQLFYNSKNLDTSDKQLMLVNKLEKTIEKITKDELTIDSHAMELEYRKRSCHRSLDLDVDQKILVVDKAAFKCDNSTRYNHTDIMDTIDVGGQNISASSSNKSNSLVLYDDTDCFAAKTRTTGIIGCDINVDCNIDMAASTDSAHGNIIKAGTTFLSTFGLDNIFLGNNSGNFATTGVESVGIGSNVLQGATSGSQNVGIGFHALSNTTSGNGSVAIGTFALASSTTGGSNVAVGGSALAFNTTGTQNVAVGTNALNTNTTGTENVGIGTSALNGNTIGQGNAAVGWHAMLFNTTGANNVAFGLRSLEANTTGGGNVALGASSLLVSNSNFNVAVGYAALYSDTLGMNNVAVGTTAGASVSTGSHNVLLGDSVGSSLTTGSNNIYIDGTGLSPANESNTIRIGNFGRQTSCFVQGINGSIIASGTPVIVSATGQLGTVVSSEDFKKNIVNINDDSSRIFDLRPISFSYKGDEDEIKQLGFLAEEVAKVIPELVVFQNGKPHAVRSDMFAPLLVNEAKKQQVVVTEQQKTIMTLESKIKGMSVALKEMKSLNEDYNTIIQNLTDRIEKLERQS